MKTVKEEQLQKEVEIWKEEAKRWRDMYMEYDEMLDGYINDAVKRINKIGNEIETIKKQIENEM